MSHEDTTEARARASRNFRTHIRACHTAQAIDSAKACSGENILKSQMLRECEGYATTSECSRNPAFMLSTCRVQCEAREKEHGLMIDRESRCVEWS